MKLPQLSVRDLFWLVLVVACLCGWAIDHWSLNRYRVAWMERFGIPPMEVLKSPF